MCKCKCVWVWVWVRVCWCMCGLYLNLWLNAKQLKIHFCLNPASCYMFTVKHQHVAPCNSLAEFVYNEPYIDEEKFTRSRHPKYKIEEISK